MANEIKCIITLHYNTVRSRTLQLHKRNNLLGYLIMESNQATDLLIITIAPSQILCQIPHTLFDITSLGVDAASCHDQDTCKTSHTCARSEIPQHNIVHNVWLFSHEQLSGQQYA